MPSRREFLMGLSASALPLGRLLAASNFKLSVITDEISQDFGHACEVAAREFGLGWVELRAMHNKNIINWDAKDIAEAKSIVQKFNLQVSELASPVFKTDWPGAPKSPFSPKKNPRFGADLTYESVSRRTYSISATSSTASAHGKNPTHRWSWVITRRLPRLANLAYRPRERSPSALQRRLFFQIVSVRASTADLDRLNRQAATDFRRGAGI